MMQVHAALVSLVLLLCPHHKGTFTGFYSAIRRDRVVSCRNLLTGFTGCCSMYLTNSPCLKVTRKIIPGPFVLSTYKDNTVFFLIVVGFTLMPEYYMWVKWCLVHPVPLAFRVLIRKSQEIWKSSIQKLKNKVLHKKCKFL